MLLYSPEYDRHVKYVWNIVAVDYEGILFTCEGGKFVNRKKLKNMYKIKQVINAL